MSDCTNCGEYSGHPCDERTILMDLISELRDHAEDVRPAGDKKVPWRIVANYLDGYADRAEARLKGLNDE